MLAEAIACLNYETVDDAMPEHAVVGACLQRVLPLSAKIIIYCKIKEEMQENVGLGDEMWCNSGELCTK